MASWRPIAAPGDHSQVNFGDEIVLQTNDKKEYVMSRKAIGLSKLLTDMLQDVSEEDQHTTVVPLVNIDGPTFGSTIRAGFNGMALSGGSWGAVGGGLSRRVHCIYYTYYTYIILYVYYIVLYIVYTE